MLYDHKSYAVILFIFNNQPVILVRQVFHDVGLVKLLKFYCFCNFYYLMTKQAI